MTQRQANQQQRVENGLKKGSLTVKEDAPLESVLGNEALRRLGALIATDADGHISGVLTLDAIGRALQPQTPAGVP